MRIITIGYQKQGESLIILLINRLDDSVLYSIVIDSFRRNSTNKTIDLLKANKVAALDMLCWSHPDFDHSCGIEDILNQFCNDTTRVITPISFWSDDYQIKAFTPNDREIKFVKKIREINRRTKCSLHPKAVSQGGCDLVGMLNLVTIDGDIKVKVEIVAPFIDSLKGEIDDFIANPKNKQPSRNQTSVTILLEVGPYRLVFPADLPNREIELMNEDCVTDPVFLKIPHHGSDSSIKMTDYLSPNSNMMACCTVYKATKKGSELPLTDVIKRYRDCCETVLCTGSDRRHDYGVITAYFDFFGEGACYIKLEGSAFIF